MSIPPAIDCWYLTGPTAGGKTGVGLTLAKLLKAEIISLDSMALYRGMDIGTAKPTAAQREETPHHLIDILEPEEEYSLAQYLEAAWCAIREIRQRGREVLFVGGTPLYLKGLLRGVFQGPAADWGFRQQLEQEARSQNPSYLHRKLAEIDPASANWLHPNDTRRIVRALEVYQLTGRPISEFQKQFKVGRAAEECRVFVLDWPREELYSRIDRRVDEMFSAGLVDEVRCLLGRPHPLSRTAIQALGYREVIEHLQGGRGLPETMELVKMHTRQFAKRQLTWFRSLSECRFVGASGADSAETVARQIAGLGHGRAG
jgi:tRNA dimethylallyltransferase